MAMKHGGPGKGRLQRVRLTPASDGPANKTERPPDVELIHDPEDGTWLVKDIPDNPGDKRLRLRNSIEARDFIEGWLFGQFTAAGGTAEEWRRVEAEHDALGFHSPWEEQTDRDRQLAEQWLEERTTRERRPKPGSQTVEQA